MSKLLFSVAGNLFLFCETVSHCIFLAYKSQFPLIKDDLLTAFFTRIIAIISVALTCLRYMSPGKWPINFFICSGQDPNQSGPYLDQPRKTKYDLAVILFINIIYVIGCIVVTVKKGRVYF